MGTVSLNFPMGMPASSPSSTSPGLLTPHFPPFPASATPHQIPSHGLSWTRGTGVQGSSHTAPRELRGVADQELSHQHHKPPQGIVG